MRPNRTLTDRPIQLPRRRGRGSTADSEAERPGGLEVDDEFECGRLLDRKISRLSSLQDAVDIASGAAKDVENAGAVGDEEAPRRTRGRR